MNGEQVCECPSVSDFSGALSPCNISYMIYVSPGLSVVMINVQVINAEQLSIATQPTVSEILIRPECR